MASQQPRPWSRFSILAGRPAPPPRPSAPPAAPRPLVPPRPSIPIRPTQTQEPLRPPPFQSAASPPAPVAVPPPPPPGLPSPVRAPSPQPSPQRAPPTAPAAAATPPPPPAPPRSSPPPQETKSPRTSPVLKETLTTSTYAPFSSSVPKSPQRNSQAPSFTQKPITTPIPSPKITKPSERTTAEPPKLKPSSRPPSPLTLPPAQIRSDGKPEPKIELQAIVEHHAIDKPVKMLTAHKNGIPSNAKREPSWNHKGTSKTLSNSKESEMRMITLAGENKGAVLELSPSGKKNYPVGNSPSLQKNGGQSSDKNGEEGKYRNKEKANGGMAMDYPGMSYFNSNVQGVNNSIVCNSAFRHNNPGIHLSMRKANNAHDKN